MIEAFMALVAAVLLAAAFYFWWSRKTGAEIAAAAHAGFTHSESRGQVCLDNVVPFLVFHAHQ